MPLDFHDQLEVLTNSTSQGDISLLARALSDPDLISPSESKTIAESLGLSNGFAKWVVNVATDPTVWIAGLLAKRFPVSILGRTGVPTRYNGLHTEFTGISKFARPVATMFRGSNIDSIGSLAMHRQARITRMSSPVADAISGLTREEKIAVVRFREEGITAGLTPKAVEVDRLFTEYAENAWNLVGSTASDVRGSLARVGQSGEITFGPNVNRVDGKAVEQIRLPREFRNYIPHLPILSGDGTTVISGAEALGRMAQRGGKRLEQALQSDGLSIRTSNVRGADGRTKKVVTQLGPWRLNPTTDTIESGLADFQRAMNGTTGKTFFGHLNKRSRNINVFSKLGQQSFVTDLDQIFAEYTRGLSRTYAWNVPISATEQAIGAGLRQNANPTELIGGRFFADAFVPNKLSNEPLIVQAMREGLDQIGVKAENFIVKGTEDFSSPVRGMRFRMTNEPLKVQALDHLIKSFTGHFNEKEQLFGNAFSGIASALHTGAQNISPRVAGKLASQFEALKSQGTNRAVNNFLASYSYYTTLGLNPSTVVGNALQTPLTTLAVTGLGPTIAGIREFAGRLPAYGKATLKNFREGGFGPDVRRLPESSRRAFNEVFPELADFQINVDPRLFELDPQTALEASGKAFKTPDSYLSWLLAPFRAVETANRGIAFFAGKADFAAKFKINPRLTGIPRELLDEAGTKLLPAGEEFVNLHAARTVNATQFLPGGGTRTIAQDMVAPWMRALTSFPIRFISLMGESTVRGGLIEKEIQLGGALERITGGRNLGTLARVFIAGNVLQKGFRDTLGLDVNRWVGFGPIQPGGQSLVGPIPIPPIAGALINTATGVATGEIDDIQPFELPGIGKIPIPRTLVPAGVAVSRAARALNQFEPDLGGFVDEDGRLMRAAGTSDLILGMLGVPTDKARRERIQLTGLRTRIAKVRDFRRKFATSILNGDLDTANQLKADYTKVFPDLPGLNVAQSDLKTYAQNARTPRIARAMRSLGSQRPFITAELYEIDPSIIMPIQTSPLQNALGQIGARP